MSGLRASSPGRTGARWAALLGSSLVGLALLELGVRGFGLAPQTKTIALDATDSAFQHSTNPILGFELRPGYRDESPNNMTSYAFINDHGQRDRERTLAKPPGIRRVLVVGDSVVEGSGVADLADTIPAQLQALYGPDTEVLNFGVSGYCTRAEIELLETKGLAFDPDVVVVVFVANDFDNFNTALVHLKGRAPRSRLAGWLFHHSDLMRVLASRFGWFGVVVPEDPFDRTADAVGDDNVPKGLARLRELAERDGFSPLIAIWPHFGWDGISDLHPMDDGSDELIVERLAAVVGIPTLRLSPAFREHFATLDGTTPRALYSVSSDAMHPTAVAAAVAARALEQRIAGGIQLEPAARGDIDPLARALAQRKGDRPPERYKPYTNQGGVLGELGRHREAIASYELALEHGPPPGWAGIIHYNIGLAAERDCDLERARQEYERAIELRPDKTYAEVRLRALPGRESACEESENAGPSSQEE